MDKLPPDSLARVLRSAEPVGLTTRQEICAATGRIDTLAAGALQRAGLLSYSRGRVTVLGRDGLESAACECYRAARNYSDLTVV